VEVSKKCEVKGHRSKESREKTNTKTTGWFGRWPGGEKSKGNRESHQRTEKREITTTTTTKTRKGQKFIQMPLIESQNKQEGRGRKHSVMRGRIARDGQWDQGTLLARLEEVKVERGSNWLSTAEKQGYFKIVGPGMTKPKNKNLGSDLSKRREPCKTRKPPEDKRSAAEEKAAAKRNAGSRGRSKNTLQKEKMKMARHQYFNGGGEARGGEEHWEGLTGESMQNRCGE